MHQWTLEDEDRTCEQNAMDPREARSSACQSTKNACENAKPTRLCMCTKCELWNHEMRTICEVYESARYLKREMHEICKITKIAKVATL
jgi:hypothetical protein